MVRIRSDIHRALRRIIPKIRPGFPSAYFNISARDCSVKYGFSGAGINVNKAAAGNCGSLGKLNAVCIKRNLATCKICVYISVLIVSIETQNSGTLLRACCLNLGINRKSQSVYSNIFAGNCRININESIF